MLRSRSLLSAVVAGLLAMSAAQLTAEVDASFQEIEESLTCQCGCGLTVHSCNHLQCPSALPLRAEIRERLALKQSKDEILAYFGDKYGEKILSAPTTEGFNVLAWTTPFLVVFIGMGAVLLIANRWRRGPRSAAESQASAPSDAPGASDLRRILEREMKDFDE